ncbi:MAG: nickel-dependent hydrogenase large subunit [Myxococcales bacterium]|jgi:Ni,Fe-hydrogenase I large subunit
MAIRTINLPVNRVEGDLEIKVEVEDGAVRDAWSSGTMFRGIERILVGRGALDGLVITPRICGICGTSHLTAAARALESLAGIRPPPNAQRVRNLALMVEHVQSDMRHAVLTFMADFANPAYRGHPLYEQAVRRYQPFKGESVLEVLKATRSVLEINALLAGQWPHSSFIVPGGVVSLPTTADFVDARTLLTQYRRWYEQRVLGCSLERFQAIETEAQLQAWLEESEAHREGEVGFFVRFAREAGLEKLGRGFGNFLSCGSLDVPEGSAVAPAAGGQLVPAGFVSGGERVAFSQEPIAEHVACSWYEDYEGGRHPFEGETRPYACGNEGRKYSWAKAPRYDGKPAETGPLAEAMVARVPLFADLVARGGANVFVRQLARLTRPARLFAAMETWLSELVADASELYRKPEQPMEDSAGYGLVEAARGALGHWVKLREGRIAHYQIVTPTAWNCSPRDADGVRGAWEEALVGTPVRDPENPVEIGHVVRSFDACLVCTVHSISRGRARGSLRIEL